MKRAACDQKKVLQSFARRLRKNPPAGGSKAFFRDCGAYMAALEDGKKSVARALRQMPSLRERQEGEIFTNQEISMNKLTAVGFDLDYTLARYKAPLLHLIYEGAVRNLVEEKGYPLPARMRFEEGWAIRGLCFDARSGAVLKVDRNWAVQKDSCYVGREAMGRKEMQRWFPGGLADKSSLEPMNDYFSLPEITLIADVIQLFRDEGIEYTPQYVRMDVRDAVSQFHRTEEMHKRVIKDPGAYIEDVPQTIAWLRRLKEKKPELLTFLLTNSGYTYTTGVMAHLTRDENVDWRELFDIKIVSAQKPAFYTSERRPFRTRKEDGSLNWTAVTPEEARRKVLVRGSLSELKRLAPAVGGGGHGHQVLFFGDHLFADLIAASREEQWKTGLIIEELDEEVATLGTIEYALLAWELTRIEKLMDDGARAGCCNDDPFLVLIRERRKEVQTGLKDLFNPHFGSVFRTYSASTALQAYITRFASVYTSNLANFMQYPADVTFFPKRSLLPHEHASWRTWVR